MPVVVFGIGIGLLLLIIAWSIVVFVCLLTYRSAQSVAVLVTALVAVFSVLLLSIPTAPSSVADSAGDSRGIANTEQFTDSFQAPLYDGLYVWRVLLVVLLLVASAGGGAAVVALHWQQPHVAAPLRKLPDRAASVH